MVASLSREFQDLNNRLRGLRAEVSSLLSLIPAGTIRWVQVYDLSTNVVSANTAVTTTKAILGMAQWAKDDAGDQALAIGTVYTTLQAELTAVKDLIVANKQPALDLDANGVKIELTLTQGQKNTLSAALTSLLAALEAVPGVA